MRTQRASRTPSLASTSQSKSSWPLRCSASTQRSRCAACLRHLGSYADDIGLMSTSQEPLCLVMNREPYVFVNGDDDQVALVELIAKTPSGGMPVGKNGARYDQRVRGFSLSVCKPCYLATDARAVAVRMGVHLVQAARPHHQRARLPGQRNDQQPAGVMGLQSNM